MKNISNQERFYKAKEKIIGIERPRNQIGTLSEKTMHAVVKNYYEMDENYQEIPIEGKCADIFTKDEKIIEIQTRSWNLLKPKLQVFLPSYDVTVVLPIPDHKQIIWIDPDTGEVGKPGPNRKYGNPYMLFNELYKIREFLTNTNMHVHVLMIDVLEYKLLSGRSKDRKKFGAERYDRIPINLTSEINLEIPEDYMQFIPDNLPEKFTAKDFAKSAGTSERLTGYIIGTLKVLGLIEKIGQTSRRAYIYRVKEIQ